jgi:hypothetical protein
MTQRTKIFPVIRNIDPRIHREFNKKAAELGQTKKEFLKVLVESFNTENWHYKSLCFRFTDFFLQIAEFIPEKNKNQWFDSLTSEERIILNKISEEV